jgi:hypothetical protein
MAVRRCEDLPAGARAQKEALELGRFEGVHRTDDSMTGLAACGVLVLGFYGGFCLWAGIFGVRDHGALLTVGGSLLLLGALLARHTWVRARRRVYVFEYGLVCLGARASDRRALRWTDVDHIAPLNTALCLVGGDELAISPFSSSLTTELVDGPLAAQLTRERVAALRAGEEVGFGPFTLGPAGLRPTGAEIVAWSRVVGVETGKETVTVRTATGELNRPASDVPDLPVFLWLVERCAGLPWAQAVVRVGEARLRPGLATTS